MTQTLIEQLEALPIFGYIGVEMYPDPDTKWVSLSDLRAIIEQHKSEAVEPVAIDSGYIEGTAERLRLICSKLGIGAPESNEELMLCQFSLFGLIRGKIDAIYKTQPDLIAELVKALDSFDPYDDFAALYQLKADIDIDALLAKAKEMMR